MRVYDEIALPILVVTEFGDIQFANGQARRILSEVTAQRTTAPGQGCAPEQAPARAPAEPGNGTEGHERVPFLELLLAKVTKKHRSDAAEICDLQDDASCKIIAVVRYLAPLLLGDCEVRTYIVFLICLDKMSAPNISVMRNLFNLTAGETETTKGLCVGKTLDEIAGELGLTIHAVRAHLKSIYRKTGVHKQAHLVRMATLFGVVQPTRPTAHAGGRPS